MDRQTRIDLVKALRQRYAQASKRQKSTILDEFVAVASVHRKHAIRILRGNEEEKASSPHVGRRIYDEAVKEALIVIWEAADRICGKRLKSTLPQFIDAMSRHGHLKVDPEVRKLLLRISPATIDRILAPIRSTAKPPKRRRAKSKPSKKIDVRTFSDWNEAVPGQLEIDFVAHCGGSLSGSFIHSFVVTDVYSGWTDAIPLLVREQSLVVEGLEALSRRFPVQVLGINSDNDSAFINDTLLSFCEKSEIEFTRSRPYRKNDQAWIEQKNGAVIRRFTGHERFGGAVAGQTLAHLYANLRQYVNYFQPSFKLKEKTRNGSKVKKTYFTPATPCDRLLEHNKVTEDAKNAMKVERTTLDPINLLHRIREAQSALVALASPGHEGDLRGDSLSEFLSQLPRLWQAGEARPTHRNAPTKPRDWRTRKDPFDSVWAEVLQWLEQEPDATAKALFERLKQEHPDRFQEGQLRTLQRRVKDWRHIMAKKLVFGCIGEQSDGTPDRSIRGE